MALSQATVLLGAVLDSDILLCFHIFIWLRMTSFLAQMMAIPYCQCSFCRKLRSSEVLNMESAFPASMRDGNMLQFEANIETDSTY